MSLNSFIPQIWSDQLLVALRANLVYANLANRDYEGDIKNMGDTVRIHGIGTITVSDYVKDTDINSPQALTDAETMLVIEKAKYFNFAVDDVDAAQQTPKVMAEAMSYAAYQVALTIDNYVSGFYTAAGATAVGSSGSPTTPTAGSMNTSTGIGTGTTVYDYLVAMGQYLTDNYVPKTGRWCVVPPWISTYLMQDIRFTGFNTPEGNARILDGRLDASGGASSDAYLGKLNGMDVYESPQAPHLSGTKGQSGSVDVVLVGHPMALTYAEGINKTEAYRPPYRFSDAVKGLCLFGAKVVRPQALSAGYFQHP